MKPDDVAITIGLDNAHRTLWVGTQPWPVSAVEWSQFGTGDMEFRTRRAVVAFESGWGVSVIWGTATYSDNRDHSRLGDEFTETPQVVEVGVLHRGTLTGDPLSYAPAIFVNALLDVMRFLPSDRLLGLSYLSEWLASLGHDLSTN